ncbi:MAG: hypothetical protein LQ343_007315 [Gyalolechia ehrenbergii]|nr:MAG: hypothetical protein LQ343_007315 [Gyalolechia ehrenbergii]
MTTADVRDMLGLASDAQPKIRPPKKAKQEVKGRRPGGLEREIVALHGDRPAPPLAINEVAKYKEKPRRPQRIRHWELTPFHNQARSDGLILKHWHWRDDGNTTAFPSTPADSHAASEEQDERITKPATEYPYAKYDIRVDKPIYNQEQYNMKLRSEDWTKDETDYLVDLAYEFDLRWVIIADRYDYKAPQSAHEGEAMAMTVLTKHRTMEDLKARYYQVAAIAMTLSNPMTSMSEAEFAVHEKMTKFDPVLETRRKQFAEGMLSRSPEEVQEEEILLMELKRIVKNEEKFIQERQELYARLEMIPSQGSAAVNRSYEGLSQLLKQLMEAERNKRKRMLGDGSSTPANGASGPNAGGPGDRGQRQSIGGPDKRTSLSASQGQRQLSARDEARYGITHHERLTAGVQFRHEKVVKLSQAKSNAQTTKIAAALTELGIPARIYMPTAKTTNEYERLIQNINVLLDVRKIREKIDAEIRVLQAQLEPKAPQDDDVEMKSPKQQAEEQPAGDIAVDTEADADAEADGEAEAEEQEAPEKEQDSNRGDESDQEAQSKDDGDDNDDNESPAGREGEDEVDDSGEGSEGDNRSAQDSPTRTIASAGGRKRSASLISSVSNKSTKKFKK